jgi:hypothetical protein
MQTLVLALRLVDRVTRSEALAGPVSVVVAGKEKATQVAPDKGTFFFGSLPNGAHTIDVASMPHAPYYRAVSIPVVIPMSTPVWPAYPDLALADRTRMLDDPAQPAAYSEQRLRTALLPTVHYPFPAGATLVRGTVLAGAVPLADATVRSVGGSEIPYITGSGGEFVLFFETPPHETATVTLRASHSARPDVDVSVDIRRALTAATNIVMAP